MEISNTTQLRWLIIRYLFIALALVFGYWIFEQLLTTPTIAALNLVLSPFYEVIAKGAYLYVNGHTVEIASDCVMALVYLYLFVLAMATAKIKPAKRLTAIAVIFAIMFTFNIARMLYLVSILNETYFHSMHWVLEHVFAAILVPVIWIATAKLLEIKAIPFYSDYMFLRNYFQRRSMNC